MTNIGNYLSFDDSIDNLSKRFRLLTGVNSFESLHNSRYKLKLVCKVLVMKLIVMSNSR
jgi:hypothetical protein